MAASKMTRTNTFRYRIFNSVYHFLKTGVRELDFKYSDKMATLLSRPECLASEVIGEGEVDPAISENDDEQAKTGVHWKTLSMCRCSSTK